MYNSYKLSMFKVLLSITLFPWVISAVRNSVFPNASVLIAYDGRITSIDDYSKFTGILAAQNYDISYHDFNSETPELSLFFNSQRLYQNLVLLPIKLKNLGSDTTVTQLLDFVNEGGSIVTITSPDALQDDIKAFLNELGIFPSPTGYNTIDHFSSDEKLSKGTDTFLKLDRQSIKNDIVVSDDIGSVLYTGSAALLSNSQLLVPILQSTRTSYTAKKEAGGSDDIYSSGLQSYFTVGFQGRNNARALWIGSDLIFSDTYLSTNERFIEDIIDWTFLAKNVIKSTQVEHYHANDNLSQETYKIKDEVVYNIGLTEWNGSAWIPYKADDVQVEVRMLNPYYRLQLSPIEVIGDSQIYSTGSFKLPDQHGMFTFYTNYKRNGLSFIEEKNVVTVRHLANDEYQRSWEIPNSWVYVASHATVVTSFLLFTFIFLYRK